MLSQVKIITPVLDKAAFYLTYGGEVKKIEGMYPECTFHVEAPKWVLWYEKLLGFVSYKRFGDMRKVLKKQARIHSGLPARFTGDNGTGFKFIDIAKVR